MRRALVFAAVLFAAGCGRIHTLQEGTYALSADEVVRDDCGLMQVQPDLGETSLTVSGDFVQMSYSRYDIQMSGDYLLRKEEFTADGSAANVTAEARGQQCLVDLITVHIDATALCPVEYAGTLRIIYQTPTRSECACQLWVRYHAIKKGADPAKASCPSPDAGF